MKCRHCGTPLNHTFLDLGFAPPSNAYLTKEDLSRPETWYPLKTKVTNQELNAVRLIQNQFHGEWNYEIRPSKKR